MHLPHPYHRRALNGATAAVLTVLKVALSFIAMSLALILIGVASLLQG